MEKEVVTPSPLCAKEALDLLNCTIEAPYDVDKCRRLLDALRNCALQNKVKKFTISEPSHATEAAKSKERS